MSIKSELLQLLEKDKGKCLSGELIGRKLHCSRTAVWKAVHALREEGYQIEAGTNRGYRLLECNNILSAEGIRVYLKEKESRVWVEERVLSTNLSLKQLAVSGGLPHGSVYAVNTQTAGKGRRGRQFFSPPGSGLYFSVLLYPRQSMGNNFSLTAAAASAVYLAIRDVCGVETDIKWVNDLYYNGKKICGILTEAVTDIESGSIEFAVVGIGINLYTPENGFPPEFAGKAGALLERGTRIDRNRLVAETVNYLLQEAAKERISPVYLRKNMVPGHTILVQTKQGEELWEAMKIEDDGRLLVKDAAGEYRKAAFGEIAFRMTEEEAYGNDYKTI